MSISEEEFFNKYVSTQFSCQNKTRTIQHFFHGYKNNTINLGFIWMLLTVLACYGTWHLLLKPLQRRWWRGLAVTINAVIRAKVERWVGYARSARGSMTPRQAIELEDAPFIGGVQMVSEIIEHPDGEVYGVWWSAPAPTLPIDRDTREQVWVILPGGMTSGNSFMIHDAARSGVFGDSRWCVFHQPGIVTGCRGRAIPAITDLKYLEHFLRTVLPVRQITPSIMGFSAGSMLAICAARLFGAVNDRCLLSCVVAIHGPDKLRDAFEALNANPFRLDISFARTIYHVLLRSRCTDFLSIEKGGGIQQDPWCWTDGWPWMVRNAEAMQGQPWMEMEDAFYSCEPALQEPLNIPTMRVIALDDPIIIYEDCINPTFFCALDEVVIQTSGGHGAAFRADPTLACRIKKWAFKWIKTKRNEIKQIQNMLDKE